MWKMIFVDFSVFRGLKVVHLSHMKRVSLLATLLILTACTANTDKLQTSSAEEEALITRVVDGDTVTIFSEGNMEYVRIIGIDAPEKGECFCTEATEKMRSLVEGKRTLLTSKTDEDRDQYDRLLRYLTIDDIDVGAQMLFEGYARNYPWFPHSRSETYKELERQARASQIGLWEKCD